MKTQPRQRLLVVSLNYAPEPTGVGKYVGEMTEWLATRQLAVRVVTAPPYYPTWVLQFGYTGRRYLAEQYAGSRVTRCPVWVPREPRGLKRVLHLLTFAVTSFPVILWQALVWRPDVVFVVAPALSSAPAAWFAARLCGARAWLHVQDFEVDAAFDLGLLPKSGLRGALLWLERSLMRRFDMLSTISDSMRAKLISKGVEASRIESFPNWVDTELIRPSSRINPLRSELGIDPTTRVIVYSGNMGEKQGLDVILTVAERFRVEPDVLFLLCGAGAARARIEQAAKPLRNVRFAPLQPLSRLNELLNLAELHLVPQLPAAEDLVLPSKLVSIMASGRPVVASARATSDLGRAAGQGGIVVEPGDVDGFEQAIRRLLSDEALRRRLGESARAHALKHWRRDDVLERVFSRVPEFAARVQAQPQPPDTDPAKLDAPVLIHAQR